MVERVPTRDLNATFARWQTVAGRSEPIHDERPSWDDRLARISPESARKLRSVEQRAYAAVCVEMPDAERTDLARYVAMLKLLADLTHSRPEWIQPTAAGGLQGVVRGANQRMAVFRGAAAAFEQLRIPDDARHAHHRLVRALRDHAAIDRRAAAELRAHKNLDRYSSGKNETKAFSVATNQAVTRIVSATQGLFEEGALLRLLSEP